MDNPLRHFKYARYQFLLQATDRLYLPEYKGSTLRGGFGYAFKKVVCALRTKECPECLLSEKCIYSYVFETPPPTGTRMMRKYPSAPHPFVLLPPLEDDRIYEPGEKLEFHLTLIGKAIDYLPYFIYTFDELGKMGLGKGRGKFSLEEVKSIGERNEQKGQEGEVIYKGDEKILRSNYSLSTFALYPTPDTQHLTPCSFRLAPDALRLQFLTPTRLKFQGELTSDLKFHIFFRNLLRRISLLSYFHCGEELVV
ncbi:MAG: hypothetical protein QME78_15505, partial [Thermodesulfobacteriota bacterium]|nr:hypothetical protein [Thermodesulfobacteriota bacterium]